MIILNIDPGFASLGWNIIDTDKGVVDGGAIKTLKSDEVRRMHKGDDTTRRGMELRVALLAIAEKWHPVVICSETPAKVRNNSVTFNIGVAWGLILSLGLPTMTADSQQLKIACCGRKSASKDDIKARMLELFKNAEQFEPKGKGMAKKQREDYWDSLGAYVACSKYPMFRMMGVEI